MFGLEFLFGSALLALPLAGLPVLLHLLFRRKSPVVPFSTLRFIKSSVQHTAARKRVQRWLLLACRMLLLLLLIWAAAQPVKKLAGGWFDAKDQSLIAAIVVDTSYSMELRDGPATRLEVAENIVTSLLQHQLGNAQVAVFRSCPAPPDQPERLESAPAVLAQWTPLTAQVSSRPLVDRVSAALELLKRQDAGQKWLIVLSDLQGREFPRPLAEWDQGRTILFDLHPEQVRSAGVTKVIVEPEQPMPGVGGEAVVEICGRSGDSRAVNLTQSNAMGQTVGPVARTMAHLDGTGKAQVRLPLDWPAEQRWVLLTAAMPADDAFAWAQERAELVELPPRRAVTFIGSNKRQEASRLLRLVLDPSESKQTAWPLEVKPGADLSGREQVAVAVLSDWPDELRLRRWQDFVHGGGTLIMALQPGLEELWPKLPETQRQGLLELLPSAPVAGSSGEGAYRVALASTSDPALKSMSGQEYRWETLSVRRFVPISAGTPEVTTLLNLVPIEPRPGAGTHGLLFRKNLGNGSVLTLATLPDIGLATPPPFLPLMVSLCLRPSSQSQAQNLELGEPLVLAGMKYAALDQLELEGPGGEVFSVNASSENGAKRFVFDRATKPGLYRWHQPNQTAALAMANVQLPAAEAELSYRTTASVSPGGPGVLVARSLEELDSTLANVTRPSPRWLGPLSLVLFLLCLEALMGSLSQLWKPIRWGKEERRQGTHDKA